MGQSSEAREYLNNSIWKNQSRNSSPDLSERKADSAKLRSRYPGKIPMILKRNQTSEIPPIPKFKYLIPDELSVAQIISVIRKNIKSEDFDETKSIFIIVDKNISPMVSTTAGELYQLYSDADGFLYVTYSGENTFGAQK